METDSGLAHRATFAPWRTSRTRKARFIEAVVECDEFYQIFDLSCFADDVAAMKRTPCACLIVRKHHEENCTARPARLYTFFFCLQSGLGSWISLLLHQSRAWDRKCPGAPQRGSKVRALPGRIVVWATSASKGARNQYYPKVDITCRLKRQV